MVYSKFKEVNRKITSFVFSPFMKINNFIYSKIQGVLNTIRSHEGYEEVRNQIVNVLLTGLLIGAALFLYKTGNSFGQGISIAITIYIVTNLGFESLRTYKQINGVKR